MPLSKLMILCDKLPIGDKVFVRQRVVVWDPLERDLASGFWTVFFAKVIVTGTRVIRSIRVNRVKLAFVGVPLFRATLHANKVGRFIHRRSELRL